MIFHIACILYNKNISDIVSLHNFTALKDKYSNIVLHIIDNSTIMSQNHINTLPNGATYYSNGGNKGLSKSYNYILTISDYDDWIMWADDDTYFSMEYLENAYNEAMEDVYNIISGIIYTQNKRIMSPFRRGVFPKCLRPNIGRCYSDLVCINSGLVIRRALYSQIGPYNESQFIDMLDYWLFDELKKRNIDSVYFVGGEIEQNFSAEITNVTRETAMDRFSIFRHDFNEYCKCENKSAIYKYFVLYKRKINIFIRYSYRKPSLL